MFEDFAAVWNKANAFGLMSRYQCEPLAKIEGQMDLEFGIAFSCVPARDASDASAGAYIVALLENLAEVQNTLLKYCINQYRPDRRGEREKQVRRQLQVTYAETVNSRTNANSYWLRDRDGNDLHMCIPSVELSTEREFIPSELVNSTFFDKLQDYAVCGYRCGWEREPVGFARGDVLSESGDEV